jgi:hypothetical protein
MQHQISKINLCDLGRIAKKCWCLHYLPPRDKFPAADFSMRNSPLISLLFLEGKRGRYYGRGIFLFSFAEHQLFEEIPRLIYFSFPPLIF